MTVVPAELSRAAHRRSRRESRDPSLSTLGKVPDRPRRPKGPGEGVRDDSNWFHSQRVGASRWGTQDDGPNDAPMQESVSGQPAIHSGFINYQQTDAAARRRR
jgi:hypothetical protein